MPRDAVFVVHATSGLIARSCSQLILIVAKFFSAVEVTAVRYGGVIHDFVLLNAIRNVPEVEAAIQQAGEGIRSHLNR